MSLMEIQASRFPARTSLGTGVADGPGPLTLGPAPDQKGLKSWRLRGALAGTGRT